MESPLLFKPKTKTIRCSSGVLMIGAGGSGGADGQGQLWGRGTLPRANKRRHTRQGKDGEKGIW